MIRDTEFGTRDKKGHWKPFGKILTNPLYIIPPQPIKFLKWLFGWNGYIFPMQFIWACMAFIAWFYFTPPFEQMKNFEMNWILFILFRNTLIIAFYTSFFHLYFYTFKKQNNNFKYHPKFLEKNSKFLFGDQLKDNLIWVFFSAVPIWTFYEVFTLWAFANELIPMVSWKIYPVYCVVLFCLVPTIRDIHFYITHRILHWKFFYRIAHRVHHNNVNPGPWSGLSMHPIEHILYFSGILIHWIIPSHPLIAMWHIFNAGIAPHAGHSGFDKIVFKNGLNIHSGTYFHYLHHKYFECNYSGDTTNFLDKFFGTFHDGSEKSKKIMMNRLKKLN